MTKEEEKKLALLFFQTSLGQTVIKRLDNEKQLQKENIMLSNRVQLLEGQIKSLQITPVNPEIEKETLQLVDNAASLWNAKKAPQYLFSIIGTDGVARGFYDNQLKKDYFSDYLDDYDDINGNGIPDFLEDDDMN